MNKVLILLICIFPIPSFANWTVQYSSGYVTDISCPDSFHAWAVELITAGAYGKSLNRILFNNGVSNTWTEKPITQTGLSYNGGVGCIAFASAMRGWAGGWWWTTNTISGYPGSGWELLSTTDGFNSNSSSKMNVFSHYQSGGVLAMETAGSQLVWGYYEGDAKMTFTYINGNSIVSDIHQMKICFADEYHGWVLCGGDLFKSSTGVNSLNTLYRFSCNDIDFIDSLHGWAVGSSGEILYTDDGGVDSVWDTLATVGAGLTCVDFVDSLNGWIGGGAIFRTRDGGKTWTNENTGNITKLCFIDTSCGWALKGGSIIKYQLGPGIEENSCLPAGRQNSKLKIVGNKIYLSMMDAVNAELKVYDLCGRVREVVYEGMLSKGSYTFEPKVRASGIYFVRVETNNFTETKKLILIR